MTRRMLIVIVAVAAVAVLLFALPLGFAVSRLDRAQAVLGMERDAARAALRVPDDYAATRDPVELPDLGNASVLGFYSIEGARIAGDGPTRGGGSVALALAGDAVDAIEAGQLLVAIPVTGNERVIGVMRVATPLGPLRRDTATTWLGMALLALAAVSLAAVVGWRLARGLTTPVAGLVAVVSRLGDGDFSVRAQASDIPELDVAAHAVNDTAERLAALVARERAFSADASHQLATPLTRLRLALELAERSEDPGRHLAAALAEADVLEATITDLLELARDAHGPRGPVGLVALLDDMAAAWHGVLAAQGRPLRVRVEPEAPDALASRAALRQVLEVLVSNASLHGSGAVVVRARRVAAGVAIDVADEGGRVLDDRVFARRGRDAHGSGIGLALARSLTEAEGGRLVLGQAGPGPVFTVLLRSPAVPQPVR